jgi:hypothetical protein
LVLWLLSDLPRKNCWTIAEWAGEATPDGMQHLLGRAKREADQVRDDLREYVVEQGGSTSSMSSSSLHLSRYAARSSRRRASALENGR